MIIDKLKPEFNESYSYEEIETIVIKKPLFFFLKLKTFIDSTYNTPIKKKEKLPTTSYSLSIIYLKVDNNNSDHFSYSSLDDNISLF